MNIISSKIDAVRRSNAGVELGVRLRASSSMQVVAAVLLSSMVATAARAQTAPATPLQAPSASLKSAGDTGSPAAQVSEIVVTANRREETLSRVPISVAAYSQATMDRKGFRSVNDIVKLTTGVNFVQNSPVTGFNIAIRGIDSRVGAGTVGVYIDDTPIQVRTLGSFAQTIYPQVFDLNRVEVLRGPQGTLFGAGSEGGTVRFITPQPSLTNASTYARSEIASTDHGGLSYEGGVAGGAPIVQDVLGFRGSVYYRKNGGYIDRVNPDTGATIHKNDNYDDSYAFQGALAWRPINNLTITPSVFYQHQYINNSNQYWDKQSSTPGITGVPQFPFQYTVPLSNPSKGSFKTGDENSQPGTQQFGLASLNIKYDTGAVTITSNSSYYSSKSVFSFDFGTPVAANATQGAFVRIPGFYTPDAQRDNQQNVTTELRVQPSVVGEKINWIAGLFYSHQLQKSFGGISGNGNDFLAGVLTFPLGLNGVQVFGANAQPGNYALLDENHSLDRQYAAFGEVSYNLLPSLKFTAGVRVARTEASFHGLIGGPFDLPDVNGQASYQASSSTTSSTPVTPKFNLAWQADRNNLFYATASKGFRVGGGNASLPNGGTGGVQCRAQIQQAGLNDAPATYSSDSLWSYEAGSKNKLFGNRMQIDASAFYIDWSNLQQNVLLPCQFGYTANAGSARSQGFDVQVQVEPTQGLTVGASVGYVDAEYTSTVYPGPIAGSGPNSRIVSRGDKIDNPPWTVVLNGRYDFDLYEHKLYVNADYTYRSRISGRSPIQDPLSLTYDAAIPTLPSNDQLNLRVGTVIKNIDASIFVNNATNSHQVVYFRHDYPGDPLMKDATFRPLTIGVTLTYRN